MVVLEQETQDGKKMKRQDNAETQRTRRLAEKPRRRTARARKAALTTPDLVLLSLLAERPMHGYQANLELERREIRDWAGISRPQVYYSLEKLARAGMIRASETTEPAGGPERSTFETGEKGRAALADALEGAGCTNRDILEHCRAADAHPRCWCDSWARTEFRSGRFVLNVCWSKVP